MKTKYREIFGSPTESLTPLPHSGSLVRNLLNKFMAGGIYLVGCLYNLAQFGHIGRWLPLLSLPPPLPLAVTHCQEYFAQNTVTN
jgi:hypothetical protein